jgi:hypothetical protein
MEKAIPEPGLPISLSGAFKTLLQLRGSPGIYIDSSDRGILREGLVRRAVARGSDSCTSEESLKR